MGPLNIAGTEWIIVVFVALVLILGTGRLPGAARKLGRAAAEYKKARDEIRAGIEGPQGGRGPTGPVGSEREKLEAMARAAGMATEGMSDDELRAGIAERMGKRRRDGPAKQ